MNAIISKLNRRTGVGVAALLIAVAYFASRLLGLFRDRMLVSHFGISPVIDSYMAAFRLPELLFTLLVSGAFAVAFIPVFAEHLEKERKEEAWELASVLLNFLALGTLLIAAIAFVFADPITTLVAPGFDEERHSLAVDLTRIMLLTPTFFAVSSLLGGIAQAYGRFIIFALASVFYNVGILFGILVLSPTNGIYGVAWGVVLGAALQAVLQIGGLWGLGYRYRPSFAVRRKDVRKVLTLMVPRSIGQGVDQLGYMIETIIGSRLSAGSLASLYYANSLKNVPLALIGSAIATAAFPQMAARAARGATEKLLQSFVTNARLILFLIVPAAIVTVIMRGYIVRLLFGFGDPTTASILGWFAGVIVFQSLFFLVARVFYSLQDTRTPLYISIGSIFINVPLSLWLSDMYGVVGLAMAQSVVATLQTAVLIGLLRRRMGQIGLREILRGFSRMLIAGAIMAGVTYVMVARVLPLYRSDLGFMVVGPKFLLITIVAAIAYLVPCYLLNLREAHQCARKFKEQILQPLNLT